jgi:hypothetical protein
LIGRAFHGQQQGISSDRCPANGLRIQCPNRCKLVTSVKRRWPLAPPADSDHQVIEVDSVQPLLIVSSAANSVID